MRRQSVQCPRNVRALVALALVAVPLGAVACGSADTSFTIDPPLDTADCIGAACEREVGTSAEVPARFTCPFGIGPTLCPPSSSASPDAAAGAEGGVLDASPITPDAAVPPAYDCEKDGTTLPCEGPRNDGGKPHKDGGKGKGKGKDKDKDKDKDDDDD